MAAATITVTVLVVLLIVAVVALLMKINKDSKRMDALGSESLVKRMANPPIERPAVMRPAVMPPQGFKKVFVPESREEHKIISPNINFPTRVETLTLQKAKAAAKAAAAEAGNRLPPSSMIRPAVMPRRLPRDPRDRRMDGSYAGEPSTSELATVKAMAAMRKAKAKAAAEAQADDIENVGDQSLMLDEDPSQEYDEMAEETGIVKIAIPQPDENWLKSRQVQPVKDLSVGIAITNDVSKQDNLQTGKITSKFPISIRPAVMPPMFPHKGPQGKPAYFEAMRAAAAKAAQERDAKAKSMVDNRARSMAENAEMQALKRIDNSGMKQYDMKKGPPARSFGIATPTRPTRLPQKRPCSDFGNGYRDDGMGCWLGDEMVVSLSERTGTTDAAVTIAKMKAKMQAAEAGNKAAMKAAKMEAAEAGNKAAMKAAKMQVAEAGNKAAMQAAEAAEYAEHQRKQNAAIEVFRFERREAAMKAAKMQAEEAGNKAAMKAAKMQAEEAGNKAAMKAAKMQAAEAVEKAAMRVEGYEMMQPWGSMVY